MQKAAEVLEFAAQDWSELEGKSFPEPRTIDAALGVLSRRCKRIDRPFFSATEFTSGD
jgi:hypothetical protein